MHPGTNFPSNHKKDLRDLGKEEFLGIIEKLDLWIKFILSEALNYFVYHLQLYYVV